MEQAKRKIKDLGYDLLGLKEIQYIKAGVSPGSICESCSGGCDQRCTTCKSCEKSKKN